MGSMGCSGWLAPVVAGLGQIPALQCFLEAPALKRALARGPQAIPGGDFAGAERQIERHLRGHGGFSSHAERRLHWNMSDGRY